MGEPAERASQFVEVTGKLDPRQDAANPRALSEPAILIFRSDNAEGARHFHSRAALRRSSRRPETAHLWRAPIQRPTRTASMQVPEPQKR